MENDQKLAQSRTLDGCRLHIRMRAVTFVGRPPIPLPTPLSRKGVS